MALARKVGPLGQAGPSYCTHPLHTHCVICRRSLNLPILRADIARYLLVYTYGGVYADLDTRALRPVEEWRDGHANVSLIVGVEADAKDIPNWCAGVALGVVAA